MSPDQQNSLYRTQMRVKDVSDEFMVIREIMNNVDPATLQLCKIRELVTQMHTVIDDLLKLLHDEAIGEIL